uniref:Uncharacterized protein n=1 Tax=Anguilla anguilla TaxID=7936 RepID=A0A0E9VT05_ANGAN
MLGMGSSTPRTLLRISGYRMDGWIV